MNYIERKEEEQEKREHSITLKVYNAIHLISLGCALVASGCGCVKIYNATDEELALLKPSVVKEQHAEVELENRELEVTTLDGEKVKVK